MNFTRVGRFVVRCRRLMSKKGCKSCHRILPQGLFLQGEPQLTEMARLGATVLELKQAMRTRGWFCRACVNKRKGVNTAETSLRDKFDTQEEYMSYLGEFYGYGMDRSLAPKPEDWLASREKDKTTTTTTASLVQSLPPGQKSWFDRQLDEGTIYGGTTCGGTTCGMLFPESR
jgi:hypothetical protein